MKKIINTSITLLLATASVLSIGLTQTATADTLGDEISAGNDALNLTIPAVQIGSEIAGKAKKNKDKDKDSDEDKDDADSDVDDTGDLVDSDPLNASTWTDLTKDDVAKARQAIKDAKEDSNAPDTGDDDASEMSDVDNLLEEAGEELLVE